MLLKNKPIFLIKAEQLRLALTVAVPLNFGSLEYEFIFSKSNPSLSSMGKKWSK